MTFGTTTVNYTAADGTTQSETVSGGTWSKTVTVEKTPFYAKIYLDYSVDESTITKDTLRYNFSLSLKTPANHTEKGIGATTTKSYLEEVVKKDYSIFPL